MERLLGKPPKISLQICPQFSFFPPTIILHHQSKNPNLSHMSSPFYWLGHLSCWLHQFSPHVCCLHSHCWFDSTTKWIFHSSNLSIHPVHAYWTNLYIPWLLYTSRYTWEKMKEERSKCFGTRCPRFHPFGPCAMSLAKHDLR